MTVTLLRTLILAVNVLFGAALLTVGGVTYLAFIQQETPRPKTYGKPKFNSTDLPDRISPLADYSSIWKMRATPGDNEDKVTAPPQAPVPDEERVRRELMRLFNIVGIICCLSDPEGSYAILKLLREKKFKTVSPGETVSGAMVDKILRDQVFFVYQGICVDLGMQAGTTSYGAPGPGIPPSKAGVHRPANARAGLDQTGKIANAAVAFPGSRRIAANQFQIERREVLHVQANQTRLINEYQPVPHYDRNNRQAGVELKKVPANSYAAQRGLQQGDIVVSINGVAVNSMDFASIGRRLKGARTLTVVVLRRGIKKTFTYNLR